jgi:hypothetical protein
MRILREVFSVLVMYAAWVDGNRTPVVRQNSGRLQNQQHTTIFPIIDLV